MKTKIAALMIALMTVCATYAQYYSGKVGETISLPNPSTPAGYNGILESTYSSDSKYLSVYSGTSSVKILSYFTGSETVRCDYTCYREVYSAGRLYYYYGTFSSNFYIKCSSSAPALQLSASPDGGQIGIGQTIKLNVTYNGSDISGCDIYYTLNGSTPSKSSTRYNSGITIDSDCTLKAIAYKDGYKTSDVLTVKYTVVDITLTADPAGGNVTKGTVVHLYSNKSNASIRYTLNGSTPTLGDPIYKPTEGIVINQSCTLRATAKINGKNNSIISTPVMEWKFTVSSPKLALTATPSGGKVDKGSIVNLVAKSNGATVSADIYYTLNGTTPTKNSTKYTSSGITMNSDCTLKAIAYKSGYETSNVLTSNYTIKEGVIITAKNYTRVYGDANPTFEYTVSGGAISSGQPAITCSATKASSVGAYDIVISQGTISDSNVQYTNGTLTITAAPLIISAGSYTMRQGDSMPLFTASYNGFKNGEDEDVLMSKPQLVCEAGMDSAPGTYKITISGATAKNYNIEYVNGTLTILSREISDEVKVVMSDAGSLPTEIGTSAWRTIKKLAISGQVNGTDIRLIRQMLQDGELEELDLREARVVSGGDYYDEYGFSRTAEDVIGKSMFYNCSNLKRIVLPASTQRIEGYAFFGCSRLKQIELPEKCAKIGDYAIAFCDSLSSVKIPASIVRIGDAAFWCCSSLSSIYSGIDNMNDVVSQDSYYSPFDDISDDCLWHVPSGTKNKYTSLSWWNGGWGVVEDLDSSTSVKVNVYDVNVDHEAWYTLRSVRLMSKPVQPGIYIFNGKKVVIR